MEPHKSFNVINPFRKDQNIGRRTGKPIVKKRLKSRPEMDSFDEYLSESFIDQSIILSRKQLTNENLQPVTQVCPQIAKTSPIIILQTESQTHVSSAHKERQETGVFIKALNPYAGNGRYGRRTGKDILAGKTKLLSNGMADFSDFFSDTDVSMSVHGTPYGTNTPSSNSRDSVEVFLNKVTSPPQAFNKQSHYDKPVSGDTDNHCSISTSQVKSLAPSVQRSQKAKKLSDVISVSASIDLAMEVNQSHGKKNNLKDKKTGTVTKVGVNGNGTNICTAENNYKNLTLLQQEDVYQESEGRAANSSLRSNNMSSINVSRRKSTRSNTRSSSKLTDISSVENHPQRKAEVSGLKVFSGVQNDMPDSKENEKRIQDMGNPIGINSNLNQSELLNTGRTKAGFSKIRENNFSLEENQSLTKSLSANNEGEQKTCESENVFKRPENVLVVSEPEEKRSTSYDRAETDIRQIKEHHEEAAVRSTKLKGDNTINLNFGGDMAGSVSKTDQAPSTQFFGIKKRLTFSKALPDSEIRQKGNKKKSSNFIMDEYFNINSSEMSAQKSTFETKSLPNLDITVDSSEFLIVDEPVVVFNRMNAEVKCKKMQKGRKKKEIISADKDFPTQIEKIGAAKTGDIFSPDKDKLEKSFQPVKRKQEKMAILQACQSEVIQTSTILSDEDLQLKKSKLNIDKSSKKAIPNLSHSLSDHNITATKKFSRNKNHSMHRETSSENLNFSSRSAKLSSIKKKSSKGTASKIMKIKEGKLLNEEFNISVTKKTNQSLHGTNSEEELHQSHDLTGLKSKRKVDLSKKEAENNISTDLNLMENVAKKSVTKVLSGSKSRKRKPSRQRENIMEELEQPEIPVEQRYQNSPVKQLDTLKNNSNLERIVLNETNRSMDKSLDRRNLPYDNKLLDKSDVNEDIICHISLQEGKEFMPPSAANKVKGHRPATKDSVGSKKLSRQTTRKALKVSKSKRQKKMRERNVPLKPSKRKRKTGTNDAESEDLEKETYLSVKKNVDPTHEFSEDVPEEVNSSKDRSIIDHVVEQNVLIPSSEESKLRNKKKTANKKNKIQAIDQSQNASRHYTPTQDLDSHDKDDKSKQRKSRKWASSKKLFTTEHKEESLLTTPVHLNLLSTLPQVTPKSGVSFRPSRQFSSISLEDVDDDQVKSMRSFPEIDTTPRNTCKSPVLMSCLKDSSSIRPRIKGRKVKISQKIDRHEVSLNMSDSSPSSKMFESGLISMSASPVHYAEITTNQSVPSSQSQKIVLPDLSHKIVHPKYPSPPGLRRSKRTRVMRLNCDRGEGIIYRRDSTGFGLVVAGIQPSIGEAKVKAQEEERRRKRLRRKMQSMTVPVKINRRLSTHKPIDQDVTMCSTLPIINPETDAEVLVECAGRRSSITWYGPELNPVIDTDPLAVGLLLKQPSFSSGELHMRPFAEKPMGLAVQTLVYYVTSGKVSVMINRTKTIFETGDAFFIPRGNMYSLENLRRNVAKLYFVDLGHPYDNSESHNSTLEKTSA
ncbi:hypothetical protein Btru_046278 [Bulinus truncatus]|nr:hypothetical protein Btru_046278 [Bulinus truncatus]